MIKFFKIIAIWIWCFPQQILGLLVRLFTGAKKQAGGYYVYKLNSGSVTLGTFIMLCEAHKDNERVLKHEQGHTKQSYILGWLFLFVIGIPSIVWAGCFKRYRKKHGVDYYSFYTEKWADKLGGVGVIQTGSPFENKEGGEADDRV